jgi:hypothetical protein
MKMDDNYQMYATDVARNVPSEILKSMINTFMTEASLNMSNDYNQAVLDRIIYFVTNEFHYLRMAEIASAFIRGSLGKFGAGRLNPRVIYGWLQNVVEEHNRYAEHQRIEDINNSTGTIMDLSKCPAGSAIIKKIEWYKAGLLTGDDWDRVDLKKLAESIGQGHVPNFRDFFK